MDELHTYYVLAGETPVLVHNSNCPSVSRQKQDQHVLGTREYEKRIENGTPTSAFASRSEADAYAKHAWENGTPVPGRPNVRDYEYGLPVEGGPRVAGRPECEFTLISPERFTPIRLVASTLISGERGRVRESEKSLALAGVGSSAAGYSDRVRESLVTPRRAFALTATRRQPYRDLVEDLAGIADLTDDTDINCDVCFSYVVGSRPPYFIRLSMVGAYAAFARVNPSGGAEFIFPGEAPLSEYERDVLRLFEVRRIRVLSRDQLNAAIDLKLPEIEHVKVYNALFSPEEEMP
ncbi:hypothetical protein [Streptomyces sp. KL116D]|uniref:hypothetical protein n=1 Tax=Streptomyces sp. KL116D TaxID=3045152 RepID=UPI0035565A00